VLSSYINSDVLFVGVNRVTLLGRAGADAEMRGSERPVVMFSLATSQSYRSESGMHHRNFHVFYHGDTVL
jgi:single-stranded DNA-binding protein